MINRDPGNKEKHMKMAKESFETAILYFQKSIEADREFTEPYRLMAITYRNLGDAANAERMDKNAVAKEVYFIKFLRDAISNDLGKGRKKNVLASRGFERIEALFFNFLKHGGHRVHEETTEIVMLILQSPYFALVALLHFANEHSKVRQHSFHSLAKSYILLPDNRHRQEF